MRDMVVSGDYKNKDIMIHGGAPYISTALFSKGIRLDSESVVEYEVVDDETSKGNVRKKQKLQPKILIAITLSDGKRCLIEMKEKTYKLFLKSCFR